MIEIVSATRKPEREFWDSAALGQSLLRLKADLRLQPRIAFENALGLPDVYNARIFAQDGTDILVFVHDDVWIDDHFIADQIIRGLDDFDVIGVAGNRRRLSRQPGWAFRDRSAWDDRENLCGAVAHGEYPFSMVTFYGGTHAECELLDGIFLAARRARLRERDVAFDPRFRFHFYDLDFCRRARQQGLRLGAWPISLTHQSVGSFRSDGWADGYRIYLDKWGE
jgi:GT2 family glycosyltransferase